MTLNYKNILEQLFDLDRSLLGKNNDKALEIISQHVPLEVHRFKSGTKVGDWNIPKEWVLHHARIKDSLGNLIVCSGENVLKVVNCSNSFVGKISYAELKKHLHVSDSCPESTPYRTNYYGNDWGFCLTREEYDSLVDDEYFVDIKSEFVDSCLNIGEAKIQGDLDKEIIFSSYLCHPQQAHDGLSGVILLMKLYKTLSQSRNKFTYRFFFGPETIGPISLISSKIIQPEKVDFCFISTCVGRLGVLKYKKTFLGDHPIDNIVESLGVRTTEFCPTGSDERQFSSPNVRIPSAHITSKTFECFNEYHTSFDDLESISMEMIEAVEQKYLEVLEQYESRETFIVCHQGGGEPFLSKYGLYRPIGIPGHTNWDRLRNWLIFYSDGKHSAIDMCKKTRAPLQDVVECLGVLLENGIIKESV